MIRKLMAISYIRYIVGGLNLLFLLAFSSVSLAQQPQTSELGCRLLDQRAWAIYIKYERAGVDKLERKVKDEEKVWLRLHNNTSCAIFIPTDQAIVTKLPDGQITGDLQESADVIMGFEIQDRERKKSPRPAYKWGDLTNISRLPAGRSVVFGVPLSYFKKKFNIVVPFKYEWELNSPLGGGRLVHRVYFYSGDLP